MEFSSRGRRASLGAFVVGTFILVAPSCGDSASTTSSGVGAAGAAGATTASTGATGSTTTGAGGSLACDGDGGSIPPLKLTEVASGLSEPAFVTSAPGDASTLFVVELDGRIQIVKDGAVAGTFLDASASVHPHSGTEEWGLLGLAFHPAYATNGRFFVYATDMNLKNHIVEYARSTSDPMKADPAAVKTLAVSLSPSAYNHNGGMLAFGRDGMLYAGVGDTAVPPGPTNPARDLQSNFGKILRIDVDSDAPPSGNASGFVWDMGLRNPWRFSFDACSGDLYVGDVGENSWEEIDVHPAGASGQDFGWPVMEGSHCENGAQCDVTGVSPITDYSHADGASVTGGYVYRGSAIPALRGWYVYGDFVTKRIWALRYANGAATDKTELTSDLGTASLAGIPSFGEDAVGNLYVVDIGGAIYRVDPK